MTHVTPPKPTAFEVDACQFSSWYSLFRDMSNSNHVDTAMDNDYSDDNDNDDDGKLLDTATTATKSSRSSMTTTRHTRRRRRRNVTIESTIIRPLPVDFLPTSWLMECVCQTVPRRYPPA